MKKAAIGALLMTVGCAAAPGAAPNGAPAGSGASCDHSAVQYLVGRSSTPELRAEAQRRSGAGTVRLLRPDEIVTMEFQADRLNIHVDNGRVTRIICG